MDPDPDSLNPITYQDPAFQVNPDKDTDPVLNPDPGFWWPKIEAKNTTEYFFSFFEQKLQLTYPLAFMQDVQAPEEAFSPQKRTSSTVMKLI